jgi:hypothetical protein
MVGKLDIRNPSHQRILAREAQAVPPKESWWTKRDLTWEQWSNEAAEADKRMNAVSTNQHVQRGSFNDRTEV